MRKTNLIVFICLAVCCSFGKVCLGQAATLQVDTMQYVVMRYDFWDTSFLNNVNISFLKKAEIKAIELMLKKAVVDYNKKRRFKEAQIRPLSEYNIQLIPVTNQNGEKIVWINAFCPGEIASAWREEIIHLSGGGNCVFGAFINLTTGRVIWMQAHDYA